jgi:hypothetical protein
MSNILISPINNSNQIIDFLNGKNMPLNSFNDTFYAIKKNLHIKQSRKYQVDSLLKKAKCKFFQIIHTIMKYCLSIRVKRLPQPFITNITIEYNRYYMEKTIVQLYNEFNLFSNIEKFDDEIIKIQNKELFKVFSKYKLDDLYNVYIESQSYKKDLKEVVVKNGKNVGILYEFVSKNLIYYYRNNKSKIPLKKKESSETENNTENIKNNLDIIKSE